MLKALHGWYQWKAEIESNLEVPSIQSTFWVMWRKFNIKLSHSVFTWPLFVRKCLFFQTNQPFTQTCDICTHIVSYMVGKLLKRSTFLRTQLHSYDANLKSYEFIPHAGISNMWDLTPHHNAPICYEAMQWSMESWPPRHTTPQMPVGPLPCNTAPDPFKCLFVSPVKNEWTKALLATYITFTHTTSLADTGTRNRGKLASSKMRLHPLQPPWVWRF